MLLTFNLSHTETLNYGTLRQSLRETARQMAKLRGTRFCQLVDCRGRIVDVLEVAL